MASSTPRYVRGSAGLAAWMLLCVFLAVQGCDNSEYPCDNGECVKATARCNGKTHCTDGSDELDCPPILTTPKYVQPPCAEGRFKCFNEHCIYQKWTCDGEDDCGDGSDEWNCSKKDEYGGSATMEVGSIVGLGIAMVGVVALFAGIAAMFFCLHTKRMREARGRPTQDRVHEVAGPEEHLPAYVVSGNALLREPPPLYSSRQDLSAVNMAFTGDEFARPPPYYSSNPDIVSQSVCSLERPPSYSSRIDMSAIDSNGGNISVFRNIHDLGRSDSQTSSIFQDRTFSANSSATLNESLDFSRLCLSHGSGNHSNCETCSKISLVSNKAPPGGDVRTSSFQYASTPAVSELAKAVLGRPLPDRRQLVRSSTGVSNIHRSTSTPMLVFDVDQSASDGRLVATPDQQLSPGLLRTYGRSNLLGSKLGNQPIDNNSRERKQRSASCFETNSLSNLTESDVMYERNRPSVDECSVNRACNNGNIIPSQPDVNCMSADNRSRRPTHQHPGSHRGARHLIEARMKSQSTSILTEHDNPAFQPDDISPQCCTQFPAKTVADDTDSSQGVSTSHAQPGNDRSIGRRLHLSKSLSYLPTIADDINEAYC